MAATADASGTAGGTAFAADPQFDCGPDPRRHMRGQLTQKALLGDAELVIKNCK